MKKGRRALSLKKRLDNQNIYDHAQINEKNHQPTPRSAPVERKARARM
jgi:hypothetical protein